MKTQTRFLFHVKGVWRQVQKCIFRKSSSTQTLSVIFSIMIPLHSLIRLLKLPPLPWHPFQLEGESTPKRATFYFRKHFWSYMWHFCLHLIDQNLEQGQHLAAREAGKGPHSSQSWAELMESSAEQDQQDLTQITYPEEFFHIIINYFSGKATRVNQKVLSGRTTQRRDKDGQKTPQYMSLLQ